LAFVDSDPRGNRSRLSVAGTLDRGPVNLANCVPNPGGAKPLDQVSDVGNPSGRGSERETEMYAVVRTGGKQYRVAAGDIVEVEKLDGAIGDVISLADVLLVANGDAVNVGQPNVDGVTVSAKITGQYRGNKIQVFRYRPKKRIRVRKGHRQYLTRLEIQSINA
jgi:large subunit ribosomal protein L21